MALPIAVLAAGSVFLVALVVYVQNLHRLVDHTDVVIGRGNLLQKLTAERENALRGFLLSRDKLFLDQFNATDVKLSPVFDGLQDLVQDDPSQVELLRAARVEVIRCRHYAAQQVDRIRDGATVEEIASHLREGTAITQVIGARIREFIATQERLRGQRVRRADTLTWYMLIGGVAIGMLLGCGVAFAIARQMRLVRHRYVAVLEDQTRIEQALATANEQLRDADRRKDEFLGVLSHELRNPLAPIRNSVHVLNHADPAGEQASRARDVIARQVDHLTRLVDDLLDVKRLSVGKMRLRSERIDVVEPVREMIEDLRALFVQRRIELRLESPPEHVWVKGDVTRLAQVVGNLLHNAAKFTDAGGHVSVAIERRDGTAHLVVRDDGAGIAPELLDRLFDPFFQGEETVDRTRGGLGLGLALVRGIVELHGGTVTARSEGAGRGTEFDVALPTVEVTSEDLQPPPQSPPSGSKRVLVIEDNEDAAESLRDLLVMVAGHEVHVARDGATGIETAKTLHPDVILCDLGLPVVDGYEVARRLRASGEAESATLVALSGYASSDDIERSREAGFDHHVAKPPDLHMLFRIISDARGSRAAA